MLDRWRRVNLRGTHRDELERPGGVGVAVALPVRLVEALGEPWAERDRELEGLAGVAEIGLAFLWQLSGVLERHDVGAHRVEPLVRGNQAERREDPGRRRDEDGLHPQLVREGARMERPCAAERDQHEVARVEALLHGHEAERAHHLGVDDFDHCGGIELAERTRRGIGVQHDAARQLGGQAAEQEIRVGHRRALATEAVAGGAGSRACALRPDAQRATGVQPDDRAAARPDRVHGERRESDREPAHDSLVLAPWLRRP